MTPGQRAQEGIDHGGNRHRAGYRASREFPVTPTGARARDLGLVVGGSPGPLNAVTDVDGLQVGYTTHVAGEGELLVGEGPVRTGVTVILPTGPEAFEEAIAAGWSSLNGNGEMTGTTWIEEYGGLTHPVGLTNTHAVGDVHRGIIDWVSGRSPTGSTGWMLPVVAETWDGYLNDINGRHVTSASVAAALDSTTSGPLAEGSVGGGTGMNCYGYKGGTGTASRLVTVAGTTYTVGTLMQANFGSRRELTVLGVPVGAEMLDDNPMEDTDWMAPPGAGSCIVVVATDAPLLPGQCKALARRVPLGLARTGTTGSHFSGDIFLAFSTANRGALSSALSPDPAARSVQRLDFLPWSMLDPLFEAVVQCVEESTLNALVAGRTMVGRDGHRTPGLPRERLLELVRRSGRARAQVTS